MKTLILVTAGVFAAASAVRAQSLDTRIKGARGTVGFQFPTRSNVCGTSGGITISNDTSPGWYRRSSRSGTTIGWNVRSDDASGCEIGPAHVVLERNDGQVTVARVTVGSRAEHVDTDLGSVPVGEATRYLLSIAPQLSGRSADNAVMGAAIAEGPSVWRRMLEIARSNDATESARKSSLFWVSQEAGEAATAGLAAVADDDATQASVRSDALFFLSQRPHGEGIPGLIKVVRESKSPKLRKDAIWFLSQSKDPRALDLFERILSGK